MKNRQSRSLQHEIFSMQTLLIVFFALVLATAGILLNVQSESIKRDENLRNVAEAVAQSHLLTSGEAAENLTGYMDAMQSSLSAIDVISIIDKNGIRLYHTNHSYINTVYDGTLPDFSHVNTYTTDDVGPSGSQRRAYAAIIGPNGGIEGFVLAVALKSKIRVETFHLLSIYAVITVISILAELALARAISGNVRGRLLGHDPDDFSQMFLVRENILETLDEGVIAVDADGATQYENSAAASILNAVSDADPGRKLLEHTLKTGEKDIGLPERGVPYADILLDRIPIREGSRITGAVAILHDRTEYTKMAEDLAGTRFLVDSMRANIHDFTNKLHVILGLLEMNMIPKAMEYIENISIVNRENISGVMHSVDDPAVAALLIGKTARAAELNVRFTLAENSSFRRADTDIPSEMLITVLGNLINNALEAMDASPESEKRLRVGLWTKPGSLLITVEDTGGGIASENIDRVFDNGFTTKGKDHGTGLYQVKKIVEGLGGEIRFDTAYGKGTTFTVRFG